MPRAGRPHSPTYHRQHVALVVVGVLPDQVHPARGGHRDLGGRPSESLSVHLPSSRQQQAELSLPWLGHVATRPGAGQARPPPWCGQGLDVATFQNGTSCGRFLPAPPRPAGGACPLMGLLISPEPPRPNQTG